jgi:hypothetical protein
MTRRSLQRADGVWPMADGRDQSGNHNEPMPCSDYVLSAISYQLSAPVLNEFRRGNGCAEDFTGAGQKQPGSRMQTGTWLSGSLEKCVQAARAEAIAVWSQMWHKGCEGTVSEV